MSKFDLKKCCLTTALFCVLYVWTFMVYAKEPQKVFIVHSYHADFEWTEKLDRGLKMVFQEAVDKNQIQAPQYTTRYLDSKQNDDLHYLKTRSQKIIKEIHDQKPDVIILSDDNALKFIGTPLKDGPYPLVFCGINADPRKNGQVKSYESSQNSITGILERYPLLSMFKLGHDLRPQAKKIYFFYDQSITGQSIKKDYERQINSNKIKHGLKKMGLEVADTVFSNSWVEWKTKLKEIDPKNSIVFFQAFFTTRDEQNQIVPYQRLSKWVADNTRLANFSVANLRLLKGFLASFAFSGLDQGVGAGHIALKVLAGTSPKDIPIVTPNNYRLYINSDRAKELNIEIPFHLLAYSKKNWDDYHRKKSKEYGKKE